MESDALKKNQLVSRTGRGAAKQPANIKDIKRISIRRKESRLHVTLEKKKAKNDAGDGMQLTAICHLITADDST